MTRYLVLLFFLLGQVSTAGQKPDQQNADHFSNEAIALFNQGQYREAMPLIEQALEIRERDSGADSLQTAATLHELGRLYTAMVVREKAESALRRALALREKHLGPDHPDTARTLGLLADYYRKVGQLKEAEPLFVRAVEVLEASLSTDAPDLVDVLTNWSKFYRDTGKYPEAESRALRAVAIGEKEWGPEHPKVAKARNELGELNRYKGKNADAEMIYQRSLAVQEKTIGANHPETGETINRLAVLYLNMGRLSEAEILQKRVLQIYEEGLGGDHPSVGASLNNLASIYYRLGRYAEAVTLFERAAHIEEKIFGPDHYHVATDWNNQATALTAMGRYAEAEPLYLRVLKIREKNPAPQELGYALNNLGKHYSETGRYAEAEPLFKKAAQVWEEGHGPESPMVAVALGNLAHLYQVTGRYAEAEPLLQKAVTIHDKAFGPEHPEVAIDLNGLGNLYRVTNRNSKAEQALRKALTIWEKSTGVETSKMASTQKNLANLYRATGKTVEAELLLLQALEIREKTLGGDHPQVASVLVDLASLNAGMGKHTEAYGLFLEGNNIHARTRESVFTLLSERQKLTFVQSQTPAVHTFLAHTAQFMTNDSNAVEASFSSWLYWKGAVQEAEGRYLTALIHSEDPEIQKKWEALQTVRRQTARMWIAGPGKMKLDLYRNILMEQERKKELLEAELSRLSQGYALEQRVGRADPQRIAALLPQGGVYLDYARIDFYEHLTDQRTDAHYLVFVLTGGPAYKVHLLDLGLAEKTDSLITAYREQIRQTVEKGQPGRQQTRQMRKYGRELYEILVQPISLFLNGSKHLLVSPDGLLHMIPWEVLVTHQGDYLLEKYQITYLASGKDIVKWDQQLSGNDQAIVMADPDFDFSLQKRTGILNMTGTEVDPLRGSAISQLKDLRFSGLPESREEAKKIASVLENQMQIPVHLYLDQKASEEALLSLKSPRVLHLATHGYFLEEETSDGAMPLDLTEQGIPDAAWEHPSLRSGIALAGANQSLKEGGDEGLVNAIKIESMNLHGTELVVLSACDTGMGNIHNGEGVFGFKRSFVLAGAQTLILSLWKIPDQTTRQLMTNFYTYWTSGLSKSESLRRARLEIRKSYDHPFYWAAFQLVGNPD